MRFKVAKRDLENALQVVGASLSSAGSDISTHFTFRAKLPEEGETKVGLEVLTYSNRIFSSCPLVASVEEAQDGQSAFTVEGKRLKQWLAFVPDAALEFSQDGSDVVARAPKGKQTFQSLDPNSFPYWDSMMEEAEVKATLEANRLSAALSYSRLFTSDRESHNPELCVSEVRDGILYSTDKRGVALIRAKGLEKSRMRVHSKDVGGFLTFLGTFDGTQVEVLEHDRATIFRRKDGAVFGEMRFSVSSPQLKIQMDEPNHHQWVLPTAEVTDAIGFLVAGAPWEDNRLRLSQRDTGVVLSMASATGKITELPVTTIESGSEPGAPSMPDEGFFLDHFGLSKLLNQWRGDSIKFGMRLLGDRGYCRFESDLEGDAYVTILAWLR